MNKLTKIKSKAVVLKSKDVDTDQIIPARFLTTTSKKVLEKIYFMIGDTMKMVQTILILFSIKKKMKALKSSLLGIILVVDPRENMRHGLYWIMVLKL